MDNGLIGYPQAISYLFDNERDAENYFLSLSEDKQLEILQKSDSNNFYENLKIIKEKE